MLGSVRRLKVTATKLHGEEDTELKLKLPLLTPLTERMLTSSDESVRQNVSFIELVASKDPVAVLKLLALANSAFVSNPRETQRVKDAILILGTEVCYEILLESALVASLLEKEGSVRPELTSFLRKYMLSMTLTMRQMRKSVSVSFPPGAETTTMFTALGVLSALVASKADDPNRAELSQCVQEGNFRLHSRLALRPWLNATTRVLEHWKFDIRGREAVAVLSRELYDVYDGVISSDQLSPAGALAYCAQWLLSEDLTHPASDNAWLELPAARVCGFDKTNIAPSMLRMGVK